VGILLPIEAFKMLGIGNNLGYRLLAEDRIPGAIRLGPRCVRIRASIFKRWLNGELEAKK